MQSWHQAIVQSIECGQKEGEFKIGLIPQILRGDSLPLCVD